MKINFLNTVPKDIYPWQACAWERLWDIKKSERLSHALLFVGIDGIGKLQFAKTFANAILCASPTATGVPCEQCHACHMVKAGSHPDLMLVAPEEIGKNIGVDKIREVIHAAVETTLKGGYRVIIIHPATAMNINAANALLKTLEEPTPNTLIILVSNQNMRLPATVISRCHKIIFSKPETAEAVAWLHERLADDKIEPHLLLKLADGAPLKALSWIENDLISLRDDMFQGLHSLSEGKADPLQLAAKWQEADQMCVIDLLLSWLTDLLRYKMTQDPARLVNSDYRSEIIKVSVTLLHASLLGYIDQIQQTRADLLSSLNLNKQLLLEDLLIRWTHYVSR